jgi:hypothetical protein
VIPSHPLALSAKEKSHPSQADWIFVGSVVLVYVLITTAFFSSPGQINDTLHDEWGAVELAEWAKAGEWTKVIAWGCPLYHGRITSYLMMPFAAVLGPSWTFIRLWPVGFGALTLGLTYFWVRDLFERRTAALSVILLLVHPSYIMGTKVGNHPVSMMIFLLVGTLWGFQRWRAGGGPAYLAVSFLLLGIGLGARFWFIWFFISFLAGILWLAIEKRRWGVPGRDWTFRDAAVAFVAFLVGGSPVLYTELAWNFSFVQSVLQRLWMSPGGELAFPGIPALLGDFHLMLSGQYFFDYLFKARTVPAGGDAVFVILFWVFCSAAVFIFAKKSDGIRWVSILFLLMLGQALLMLNAWKNVLPDPEKWFLFYPLPQVMLASVFAETWRRANGLKWMRRALMAVLIILLGSQIRSLAAYYRQMARTGPMGISSDAAYDLTRWLRENTGKNEPVIFFSSDALLNARFHLAGQGVGFIDATFLSWRFDRGERMGEIGRRWEAAAASERFYVVRDALSVWDRESGFFGLLDAWCQRNGRQLVPAAAFPDRDGTPLFTVYVVQRTLRPPLKAAHSRPIIRFHD